MNWDTMFATAHLTSGPGMASLCIQNAKPPHETAFNLFQRDKAAILAAASKHGYRQINETGKSISFVHSTKRGEL